MRRLSLVLLLSTAAAAGCDAPAPPDAAAPEGALDLVAAPLALTDACKDLRRSVKALYGEDEGAWPAAHRVALELASDRNCRTLGVAWVASTRGAFSPPRAEGRVGLRCRSCAGPAWTAQLVFDPPIDGARTAPGPFSYSIDGGRTYQESPLFTRVPVAQAVAIAVRASDGALFTMPGIVGPPCSGHGVSFGGRCFCDAGWAGEACATETEAEPECPADCNGQGACLYGRCFCEPGSCGDACEASGAACGDEAACPGDCSDRGVCLYGRCFCQDGFAGEDCAVEPPEPACSARGAAAFGRCFCDPGYAGPACERAVPCPEGCSNRGVCSRGACFCDPGFAGPACEIEARSECSGHGLSRYGACYCDPGYEGEHCEKAAPCAGGCSDRGVCAYGKCFCEPGFEGEDCSVVSGPDCAEHGVAHFGKCFCEPGYEGERCEVATACPSGCKERGLCLYGKCFCNPGYGGADCGTVTEGVCSNHGAFLDGHCVCSPGYSGELCQVAVEIDG